MSGAGRHLPVEILSGFLGSGKTTLLRAALEGDDGTAVIVNEYGCVGFDHQLLRDARERIELVGGGCACCARRADLADALRGLLDDHERGRARLRRVVIETSGLADPAPIAATLARDPLLRHRFALERISVCVDAVAGAATLAASPEATKQVLVADELVLTKLDLAAPAAADALHAWLRALNPRARVEGARKGRREPLVAAAPAAGVVAAGPVALTADHADRYESALLVGEERCDWLALSVWLSMLLAAWGERVLRVKGLLEVGDGELVSLNGVQHTMHPPEHIAAAGRGPDARRGLLLITRGLAVPALRASHAAFQALAS